MSAKTQEEWMQDAKDAEAAGDLERANKIYAHFGMPPARPPNTDPQLQADTGLQEFGNVLSGLPMNALTGLGEMGSAVGRTMAQGLDFLGPGTINAGLRLAGADTQLPTFEGGYEQISEMAGSPTGGYMQPGTARDVVRGYGGAMPAALSMAPVAGRNIATPAGAAFDPLGLGTAAPRAGVAPIAFGAPDLPAPVGRASPIAATPPQRGSRQAVGRLIEEDPGNIGRAGRELDPYTGRTTGYGMGVPFRQQPPPQESIKQGLDEGFVAMVQGANRATKDKMKKMVESVGRGREHYESRSTLRPLDIAGDSFKNRVDVVKQVNSNARDRIDDVADTLKGQDVDVSPAINKFIEGMRKMGIDFGEREAISLGFEQSDIALAKGRIKQIKDLVGHMAQGGAPDAYKVHQLKRAIDEMVTYGKAKKGLGGRTEHLLKSLRRDLDGILDNQFPAYDKVNTEYSETIDVLDELQRLAGKKNDLFGQYGSRVLGTLLRRIESNAASGPQVMKSIDDMDTLSRKYTSGAGKEVGPYTGALGEALPEVSDDSVRQQVLFADYLNRQFGTPAGTSFQGEIAKVMEKGAEDSARGRTIMDTVFDTTKGIYNASRRINEDNAFDALRRLVE